MRRPERAPFVCTIPNTRPRPCARRGAECGGLSGRPLFAPPQTPPSVCTATNTRPRPCARGGRFNGLIGRPLFEPPQTPGPRPCVRQGGPGPGPGPGPQQGSHGRALSRPSHPPSLRAAAGAPAYWLATPRQTTLGPCGPTRQPGGRSRARLGARGSKAGAHSAPPAPAPAPAPVRTLFSVHLSV